MKQYYKINYIDILEKNYFEKNITIEEDWSPSYIR